MILRALSLLLLPLPALAQDANPEAFRGTYGSASDPATSCAANPHTLDFLASPPHAILSWTKPVDDGHGGTESYRRYDLLDMSGTTLTLRLEGDPARTDSGARPTWILRLTSNPRGYCWGRTDWPAVHCEDQQLLCDAASS